MKLSSVVRTPNRSSGMLKRETRHRNSARTRHFVNINLDHDASKNGFFLERAGERFGSLYASTAGSVLRAAERFLDWRAELRSQRNAQRAAAPRHPVVSRRYSRDR